MLYDNFRNACFSRGTTLTETLIEIGRASSGVGKWKSGAYPNLKITMEIADHLHISLDELCYGPERVGLTQEETKLLGLFRRIPEAKRQMCLDFLNTHAADDPAVEAAEKDA